MEANTKKNYGTWILVIGAIVVIAALIIWFFNRNNNKDNEDKYCCPGSSNYNGYTEIENPLSQPFGMDNLIFNRGFST